MKNLRIGVVGAGANTKLKHLPGFQKIEGVSVDVVCNRSEASSRAAAEAFGIPRVASDWKDVVADPEIDAICIGTWPYLHAPITIAALENGKHVLTEARMAMNAEEAQSMLAASLNRPDLVAQIVPSPFTLKWDKTIARILGSGALGELREISIVKTLPMNVDANGPLNWRQDREFSGNNTLMLGIYYEAAQRWLGMDPERVSAHGAIFTSSRMDTEKGEERAVRIPETLTALAEYETGLRLSCHMTGLELGSGTDQYSICGSLGTLRLDLKSKALYRTLLDSAEELVEVAPADAGDWRVESDFVESIRDGAPVRLTNFEDGLSYMRFTDAVVRSIESEGDWREL